MQSSIAGAGRADQVPGHAVTLTHTAIGASPQLQYPGEGTRELDSLGWTHSLCISSYRLRIGIRVNRGDVLERLLGHLPPAWKPIQSPHVDRLYSLWIGDRNKRPAGRCGHRLYAGSALLHRSRSLDELSDVLEGDLQLYVADAAPHRVFVHAGVVGWRGRAIVLPGRSFSGKTTLVAALLKAGASYYSDEYAVLDGKGRVHAYPRPLSIRDEGGTRNRRCPAKMLGGVTGSRPLPVALVAVTEYRPGIHWNVRALSPGEAALTLMANTVSARRKPLAVLDTVQQVVSGAVTLTGVRGEAGEVVDTLLGCVPI